LIGPTILLGLAFVSLGMLVSTVAPRQSVAASLVVVIWFLLVFFYDLDSLVFSWRPMERSLKTRSWGWSSPTPPGSIAWCS
jgi:ABC-type transport system involved in multi-copper enzyme maturation permease subunit